MANLGFKAGFLKHLYISYISVPGLSSCSSVPVSPSRWQHCQGFWASSPCGGEMLLYIGGDALWLAWHHSGALFLPQEDPTGG